MTALNDTLLQGLGYTKGFVAPYITASTSPIASLTVLHCVTPWEDATFQWYRDDAAISGETGAEHTVTSTDSLKSISCVAAGTKLKTAAVTIPFISSVPFGFPAEPTRPYLEP